jgi:hypothetical protein
VLRYRSLVGALMYLATCTRPDIAYVVGQLSMYMAVPTVEHWMIAKRVLRYLKGTQERVCCMVEIMLCAAMLMPTLLAVWTQGDPQPGLYS